MAETLRFSRLARVELKAADGWKFTERPGGWWIAEGPAGQRHRLQAVESRGQLSFHVDGRAYAAEVQKTSAGAGAGAGASAAEIDAELVSQFPGKVRKILVQAGAEVELGQPLLLIEAMKMEFSVKAPARGRVAELLVKEGQQLSPGDRFVRFEVAK
jgi:3-methylcrotonyl-CoA carboxylase alpha subunit